FLSFNNKKNIIDPAYVDSLMTHYTPSTAAHTNELDLLFWKKRVDSAPDNFVNLQKYAQALSTRFHIYGNIYDLRLADSIVQSLGSKYHEPGFLLSLAGYGMLQHRFAEAGKYIDTVTKMKAE